MIPVWAKVILVGLGLMGITAIKHYWPHHYKDDNIVEEHVEHFIDLHTGIDVDLTPESPEK